MDLVCRFIHQDRSLWFEERAEQFIKQKVLPMMPHMIRAKVEVKKSSKGAHVVTMAVHGPKRRVTRVCGSNTNLLRAFKEAGSRLVQQLCRRRDKERLQKRKNGSSRQVAAAEPLMGKDIEFLDREIDAANIVELEKSKRVSNM